MIPAVIGILCFLFGISTMFSPLNKARYRNRKYSSAKYSLVCAELFCFDLATYFVYLNPNLQLLPPLLTHWFSCSNDICDDTIMGNATMCPQCDTFCPFWKLKDACILSRVTYLFDNSATVFFSIFMSVWGEKSLNFALFCKSNPTLILSTFFSHNFPGNLEAASGDYSVGMGFEWRRGRGRNPARIRAGSQNDQVNNYKRRNLKYKSNTRGNQFGNLKALLVFES